MAKYDALFTFLKNQTEDKIILTYKDIESIIGSTLPPSTYNHIEFWSNGSNHTNVNVILDAGYNVDKNDLVNKTITLVRKGKKLNKNIKKSERSNTIKKIESKIIKITNNDLEKASIDVANDHAYGEEEKLLRSCFIKYPNNTIKEIVAMKIGLIDITNSTNISRYKSKISVVELTDILLNIQNLDKRIENGDLSLVSEISKKTKELYGINLFSFASKYCCYHNMFVYGKDDYVIYDSKLMEHIPDYSNDVTKNNIENMRLKCDYESYYNIIESILDDNNITCINKRRKFDNLVWYHNR